MKDILGLSGDSVGDPEVAETNSGLYIKANNEGDLIEALEKTLDCPMVSQNTQRK